MSQSLRNRINLQRHEDPRKALMILLRFLCWAACSLLALMSDAKTQRTYVEQNKLLLWCKKAQKPMTEKLMFLVLNSKSTHSHILLSLEIYKYMALSVLPIRAYPGGGGTPLYGLYGDVPLDRVWFRPLCPKQGL